MQDEYNNLNTEEQDDAVKEAFVQVEPQEAPQPAVPYYPESGEVWGAETDKENGYYGQEEFRKAEQPSEVSQTYAYYDTSAPQEITAQIPKVWKSQAEQLYEANNWLPAGFWVRLCARMLDAFVEGIVGFCGQLASVNLFSDFASRPFFFSMSLGLCFWVIFVIVYQTLMVKWTGSTLGKMALRLNVVDLETGGPVSWWQAFFRASFGRFLSDFTVVGNLLAIGKDHRTLNDRLSDTCVVYRNF